MINQIQDELKKLANPEVARHSQKFFKTAKGQYGEGDIFLGIRVPQIRELVKQFSNISINEVAQLLASPYHEQRLFALLALVKLYKQSDDKVKARIFRLYTTKTKYINNWDLIDSSAPQIVGAQLYDKDNTLLYTLLYNFAKSKNIWKRRIAILATFYSIKQNQFEDTLNIAAILLHDEHDLIHKAVGWMLREVGNRDRKTEEDFLLQHYKLMPRTMLRYAIEKFPEKLRLAYLKGRA